MKNQLTIQNNKHPEVENLLHNKEIEINSFSKQEGADMASSGKPTKDDTNLGIFTNGITTAWQTVMQKIQQMLGAENARSKGKRIKTVMQNEKDDLLGKVPSLQESIRIQNIELWQFDDSLQSVFTNWYYAKILLVIVILGEVAINFQAFNLLTGGLIMSLIATIAIGIGLFIFSIAQHKVFVLIQHKVLKWTLTILIALIVLSALYALATMRINYLQIVDKKVSEQMSPFLYVSVSFFFYIVGIVITAMYLPSREESKAYERYNTALNALIDTQDELEKTEKRIEEIPIELNKKLSELYAILVMTHNYENQVEALHQASLAIYIKSNLSYRHGATPPIFLNEMPTIKKQFETFFTNQENQ